MRKKRGKEIFRIETHKPMGMIIILIIFITFLFIGLLPSLFSFFMGNFHFSIIDLVWLIPMILILILLLLLLFSPFVTYLIIYDNGVFIRKSSALLYFIYKKYIPFDIIDDVKLEKERRSFYRGSSDFWVLYIYTKDQKIYETSYDAFLRKKKKLEKALKLILKNKIP